jgi:hypothetical protein
MNLFLMDKRSPGRLTGVVFSPALCLPEQFVFGQKQITMHSLISTA